MFFTRATTKFAVSIIKRPNEKQLSSILHKPHYRSAMVFPASSDIVCSSTMINIFPLSVPHSPNGGFSKLSPVHFVELLYFLLLAYFCHAFSNIVLNYIWFDTRGVLGMANAMEFAGFGGHGTNTKSIPQRHTPLIHKLNYAPLTVSSLHCRCNSIQFKRRQYHTTLETLFIVAEIQR